MAQSVSVAAPILSELDPLELPDGGELDELVLSEALVERHGSDAITTRRVRVQESELHGLTLGEGVATEFVLRDARCDLAGADFRGARLKECTRRPALRAQCPALGHGDCGSLLEPRLAAGAEGGGTTGPMSPSGASSRSTITGA